MQEQFTRTELLIGKKAINKLQQSKVAVFGIGGVGSFVVEALARVGVGELVLVDHDTIAESNINRQIQATHESIGKYKVEEMEKRIKQINPECKVITHKVFYQPDSKEKIIDETFDYIVDAVDNVTAKLFIIEQAKKYKVKVISAMGTGNKLDPSQFEICDIAKTSVCPLAKVMRKELKKRNIEGVKVIYSKEEQIQNATQTIASISFVPSVAGLMIAGEVVRDFITEDRV